jgi:hypothetical protein
MASLSVQELSCKEIWGDWVFMDSLGHRVSLVTLRATASQQISAIARLGFGIQYRILRMGKHFAISGFGQAAYFGSHVHATYFDPDLAVNVDYRDSDRDPLVTVGPEIDYILAKGVRIAIRPGKNFGKNFAAETVGGLSINVGVLIDAQSAGIHIAKGFKKILR